MTTNISSSSSVQKLASLIHEGYCPTFVTSGEVVEYISRGGQNWGSGGYSASGGKLGGEVLSTIREDNQFTWNVKKSMLMSDDSLAWSFAYDCIGEGREWRKLYVCMSDEDIQAAKRLAWQLACKEECDKRRQAKAKKSVASAKLFNELVQAGAPVWGAESICSDVASTSLSYDERRCGWTSCIEKRDNLWDLGSWAEKRAEYARNCKLEQERWDAQCQAEFEGELLRELEGLVPQAPSIHASGWLAEELNSY